MDRKLGIAVIGLHMGYGHFKQANEHPQAELVAICDMPPRRREGSWNATN